MGLIDMLLAPGLLFVNYFFIKSSYNL